MFCGDTGLASGLGLSNLHLKIAEEDDLGESMFGQVQCCQVSGVQPDKYCSLVSYCSHSFSKFIICN